MAKMRKDVKKKYEDVMGAFSDCLKAICISEGEVLNITEAYTSKEDISREFTKRCTNGKVFESLIYDKNSVIEVHPDGHYTHYIRKNYNNLVAVIGDRVIVA